MKKNIHNLNSLEKELQRLQSKSEELENKLDGNLHHLQDNYSSMIMNSVLQKGVNIKNTVAGTIAGAVLGNDKLQQALSKILNNLLDRGAEAIDYLADKIGRKD
jgi:uncharacterized protein YlxW (UPF0749 family)